MEHRSHIISVAEILVIAAGTGVQCFAIVRGMSKITPFPIPCNRSAITHGYIGIFDDFVGSLVSVISRFIDARSQLLAVTQRGNGISGANRQRSGFDGE